MKAGVPGPCMSCGKPTVSVDAEGRCYACHTGAEVKPKRVRVRRKPKGA